MYFFKVFRLDRKRHKSAARVTTCALSTNYSQTPLPLELKVNVGPKTTRFMKKLHCNFMLSENHILPVV